eukprot:1182533-Prorocentrum_minimum.AAC.2
MRITSTLVPRNTLQNPGGPSRKTKLSCNTRQNPYFPRTFPSKTSFDSHLEPGIRGSSSKGLIKGITASFRPPHFSGVCENLGGELNSPVVKGLIKGITASFRLRHFSGVRENFGGELNSSVVKGLIKGLMAVLSPTHLNPLPRVCDPLRRDPLLNLRAHRRPLNSK